MSRLHEISGCDNNEREADLIFIHGLGGDAFSTWGHDHDDSSSWPLWVGKEFPQIGVWSLGYASSASKWTRFLGCFSRRWRDKGQSMALHYRARQLLDLLALHDIGHRPIVFVCHSLGGLLVKQILRTSHDAGASRLNAIFKYTRAVLFLATPHIGANLATLANKFRLVFNGTVSIRDLEAHNAALLDLYDWYREHSQRAKIRTVTYFETRKFKGVTIVHPGFAHPGVGSGPVPLDEDHISICKPRDGKQQVCRALDLIIQDCLYDSRTI